MKEKGCSILGYSAERERENDECKFYPVSFYLPSYPMLTNALRQ